MSETRWQPIDTAPTNVSVLIYVPDYDHYGIGVLRAIQVDMGTGRRWHTTGYAVGRDLDVRSYPPSHWMPLPDAPEDAPHA